MGQITLKRIGVISALFLAVFISIAGCRLQYSGEEFSLKFSPDGSVTMEAYYKDFGSQEYETHLRKRDMELVRNLAREKRYVTEAREKGVTIMKRRLDFVESTLNAFVKARAKSPEDMFRVFTNYTFEISDKIYLTPLNGTVHQAVYSNGGEIIIRDNKYTFAWPLGATEISFKASYKTKGNSFRYDAIKKSKRR